MPNWAWNSFQKHQNGKFPKKWSMKFPKNEAAPHTNTLWIFLTNVGPNGLLHPSVVSLSKGETTKLYYQVRAQWQQSIRSVTKAQDKTFMHQNFLYAEMVDLERNGLEMKLPGYEVAKAKSSNESARFSPSVFGVSSTRVTPCLCTWFVISVSMLNSFAVCFSCFLFRRVYISFIRFSPLTSVHGWFPSSCEHDNIPARNKFNQIFCSCFQISKYESWILSLSSSFSPTLSICVLVFFRSICTNIPFNLYKFASDLFLWG